MNEDLIKYGKMLFTQGLNNSHSGNMSVKKGKKISITRHGARLGDLSSRDIVTVNLNNTLKDKPASIEIKVHRAIYQGCPEAKAVVHAHAIYATVQSLVKEKITPLDSEAAYYLKSIPVLTVLNAISSDDVAQRIPEMLCKNPVVIVRGHGIFAVGSSIEEASMYCAVAESSARIQYLYEQAQRK